jgi:hypothetical protein
LAPQRRACDRGISYRFDVGAVARFDAYFAQIGACLRDKRKREAFAMRAFGILREGERESAEPIAAHACVDVGEMQHMHDKLLHFLSRASWDAASPPRKDRKIQPIRSISQPEWHFADSVITATRHREGVGELAAAPSLLPSNQSA